MASRPLFEDPLARHLANALWRVFVYQRRTIMVTLLVTGGRNALSPMQQLRVEAAVKKAAKLCDTLVCGCAPGVDTSAVLAFERHGGVRVYKADWKAHGRAAGPIRNREMIDSLPKDAMALIFPGGKGTADCKRQLLKLRPDVKVFEMPKWHNKWQEVTAKRGSK